MRGMRPNPPWVTLGRNRPEKSTLQRVSPDGGPTSSKIVLPGDEAAGTAGAVADLASAGIGKLEFQIDQLMPVRADHARQVRR